MMVLLDGDVLVLDRAQEGDDVLPLLHQAKGARDRTAWFLDCGIEEGPVLHWLIDAEILEEPFAIRFIARDGASAEAEASIEELVSDADGHRCRLRGAGAPPAALLGDEPKLV